nr:hypothetical protein KPHV_87280 [Kitasatospora purpeofusca]
MSHVTAAPGGAVLPFSGRRGGCAAAATLTRRCTVSTTQGGSLALRRLLLAPGTSVRALWLWRGGGAGISFDVAWRRTRLGAHPDEAAYQHFAHRAPAAAGAGIEHQQGGRRG